MTIIIKFNNIQSSLNHILEPLDGIKNDTCCQPVQINQPMREHQQSNDDVLKRVNLFLDREMNQEAAAHFRSEMNQNPAVHEALLHEQSFRDLLKNSVHRRKVSPNLIQNIKDKIRTAPHQ